MKDARFHKWSHGILNPSWAIVPHCSHHLAIDASTFSSSATSAAKRAVLAIGNMQQYVLKDPSSWWSWTHWQRIQQSLVVQLC